MRIVSRSILVGGLAMLQFASASGHVLHHAVEAATPIHCACDATPIRVACASSTDCDQNRQADPSTPHNCDTCLFCDASDADFVPVTQQPRPIGDSVASAAASVVPGDSFMGPTRALPPAAPPPNPASLHAVTLPLLD